MGFYVSQDPTANQTDATKQSSQLSTQSKPKTPQVTFCGVGSTSYEMASVSLSFCPPICPPLPFSPSPYLFLCHAPFFSAVVVSSSLLLLVCVCVCVCERERERERKRERKRERERERERPRQRQRDREVICSSV